MPRIAPATTPPTQTSIEDLLANVARAANEAVAAIAERSSRQRAAVPTARREPNVDRRTTTDARAFCAELVKWEGCTQHMYVDTRGHVTTGIGHLLPNAEAALALPWRHKATGQPATAAEVRAAFDRVRAQGPGHKALSYRLLSDLVLPPGVAGDLAVRRLDREFLPGLRRLCPSFDRYPVPAQHALVDMAYNLGVGGLSKFHKLLASCERGDFVTASNNCHRRSSREPRNAATQRLFLEAANLTASLNARAPSARS